MKNLLYCLLLCAVVSACSNDFDVTAPWKEVPVAYGILSPKDTAQYVRIEKAFLDPTTSAQVIAKIADSLYYPENAITVWLERPLSHARVQLHRVDGNLDGHPRAPGTFADSPNWLYKVVGSSLVPGETYRLVIVRNDGKPDVTAETVVPKDFIISTPDPTDIVRKVNFFEHNTTNVTWRTDEFGVYFNVIYHIPVREETPNGTVVSYDTLVWNAAKNIERTESQVGSGSYAGKVELSGAQFYKFLAEHVTASDNYHYFGKCTLTLEGGGKEIKEFNVTAAANSGVTGAETYPIYTNLSEGFGIFTAKNSVNMGNIVIGSATIDSMKFSPITQTLKFRL